MANLVARSLKTAIEQNFLVRLHYQDADLSVVIQFLHGRLLARITLIFGAAEEILLVHFASKVHLLSCILSQLVR